MRRRGKRHACREEGHRARDCRTLKVPATASAVQGAAGCNGAAQGQPRVQYPCLRRPIHDEGAHTQPVPWPNLSVITISLDTCIVSAIWLEGGKSSTYRVWAASRRRATEFHCHLEPDEEWQETGGALSTSVKVPASISHRPHHPNDALESTVLHRSGKM